MTTVRTISDRVRHDFDFGVTDRLNRRMGMYVDTFTAVYVEDPEAKWGYRTPPGTYYFFITQTTRDGERKQASHESDRFDTPEQRDAAMAKAVEATRKRALKPEARTKA